MLGEQSLFITSPPMLGFAAYTGTGKTTLLRRIIPLLQQRGLRLGLIKHSHHTFEIDRPGKDSYMLRRAGAVQVLISSARRTVLIAEHSTNAQLDPKALTQRLSNASLDLILVEGFKHYPFPKIELNRPSLGYPLICRDDPFVIAVVTDAPLPSDIHLPCLDLEDSTNVADFIQYRFLQGTVSQRT